MGELPLLARYFARRVTTIATNANAASTTAAMPIFFICSYLPKCTNLGTAAVRASAFSSLDLLGIPA
jgi:hypothetical protein